MRDKRHTLAALFLALAASATAAAQTNTGEPQQLTDPKPAIGEANHSGYAGPFAKSTGYTKTGAYYSAVDTAGSAAQSGGDGCGCGGSGCNGNGCGESGCDCDDDCGIDFSLASMLGVDERSPWKIGGWTEGGYSDHNIPLSNNYNDLLSFQDVPGHFQVNQQWFYLERDARSKCGKGVGGRIDVVYGTDAQKTQAFGNPNAGVRNQGSFDASWDLGEYGWAIPQLYGELANCDWSLKVGNGDSELLKPAR